MKKLGFIALVLLSFSVMAVVNNTPITDEYSQAVINNAPAPSADAFSQDVFTKAPAPSVVFDSINDNQLIAGLSQCEIDCLNAFRSCIATAQGIFEWLACENTYESCAANCN